MPDTKDPLAALPLTPDEEFKFRESVRLLEVVEGESGVNALHWTNTVAARLLATLDAARSTDTGLREAAQAVLDDWDNPDPMPDGGIRTSDRMDALRAALEEKP